MTNGIKFPLDFERLETTRLFVLKLQSRSEVTKEVALLACFRIWMDWFLSQGEFRPLKTRCMDVRGHDWADEDVCFVLTEAANVPDARILMQSGLDSGFFLLSTDKTALSLAHFWRFNPHCSPHFKTIQQKGGAAAAVARAVNEMKAGAAERRVVLESQGALSFGVGDVTAAEKDKCILLIDRFDRALGRNLRSNAEYLQGSLLADAIRVVRQASEDAITAVEAYLLKNRRRPEIPDSTERALIKFSELLLKAS